jgi:hypothetical protein
VRRQPEEGQAALARGIVHGLHQPSPDAGAAHTLGDGYALDLGAMGRIRGAARDEVRHSDDLAVELGDEHDALGIRQRGLMERFEIRLARRPERHPRRHRLGMQARELPDQSSVEVVGPSGSDSYVSGAHGFSPSSAPLEPSGSAGPSAGGPASS